MNKFNELVCLLDKSDSMNTHKDFLISQYNNILKQYNKGRRGVLLTTFMFNDTIKTICDKINIKNAEQLILKDFLTSGKCMYLDSLGKTIHKVADSYVKISKNVRPKNVTFIVITSECNEKGNIYSFEYDKNLINHMENKYNWKFIFITPTNKQIYDFSEDGYDSFWEINH